jgi:hypothetical protein
VFAASHPELTHRHYAMLRAVAAGRCELTCSCEPDLFIDGRSSCDQQAAHLLAKLDLIAPARQGRIGQRVPAQLTPAGRELLDLVDGGNLASAA